MGDVAGSKTQFCILACPYGCIIYYWQSLTWIYSFEINQHKNEYLSNENTLDGLGSVSHLKRYK